MFKKGGNSNTNTAASGNNQQITVPLYDSAPTGSILTEELESLISTRIQILNHVEARGQKSDAANMSSASFGNLFLPNIESNIGWLNSETNSNDKVSHFIVSIAFCRNEQERTWFANLESKLFSYRLDYYKIDSEVVLKSLNIPLEKEEIENSEFLSLIRFRESNSHNVSNTVYKVPFEYALNFIPTMQFFLANGYVYITKTEISQLIRTVFKENLLKKLANINKNIDRITSDTRINYLIKDLQMKREGKLFLNLVESLAKTVNSTSSQHLNVKDIEGNADKTFPLCMQILHKSLTQHGHLKHFGRLQYGLFLKGIGLSLDESLNFWRQKFSKTITDDKFDKNYAYNIRHSYGQEGKRNDYIPWSCTRVQNLAPPSSVESHGCPYKVYTDDKLKAVLYDLKFKELDVLKIMEKKRNNEYSVNCF